MGPIKKIVALHGWTYSLEKWESFAKYIKKSGHDLELLEIPGLTHNSDEIWDLQKYTDWLKNKIGSDKIILLGHSNGGRIALHFTAQYPENVENLVLIDSAGIYHKEISILLKRFILGGIAKVGKKITNSETLKKFLYRLAGEKDYTNATPNMKKTMINLINTDSKSTISQIKVPTLIIWGSDDTATPLKDGKLIHKLIQNSKLKIIKGARHSPFYTHPKETAEIITTFLK